MTTESTISELLGEVRLVYQSDVQHAPRRIETLLREKLDNCSVEQRMKVLKDLIAQLGPAGGNNLASVDSQMVAQVFGLILGKKVTPDDLSSKELLERLAQSLNTIFDALNQLISVINMTLSAGSNTYDQTIRQFIGFHLEGDDQTKPLEDYLGQINQAFLTTQKAFKKAAQIKMMQVIQSLDPKKIAEERRQGGLKIGPLRKAEDFDILKEKIERIQRWFESGRFMEDFLREFEKNCQTYAYK